jgi:hypothetical protein
MFDCDKEGNLKKDYPKESWESANNLEEFHAPYVETFTHYYTESSIGLCDCGREVTLYGFTNTCDCGADYNMSGQRLAHRSQWGEETGETYLDILDI